MTPGQISGIALTPVQDGLLRLLLVMEARGITDTEAAGPWVMAMDLDMATDIILILTGITHTPLMDTVVIRWLLLSAGDRTEHTENEIREAALRWGMAHQVA